MRAIIRKDLQLKAEDPPLGTSFRLRNRPVAPEKIERYRRCHDIDDQTVFTDVGK